MYPAVWTVAVAVALVATLYSVCTKPNQDGISHCLSHFLCQMLVIYMPWLQQVFQTEALSLHDLVFITFVTLSMVILDTARKLLFPDHQGEPSVSFIQAIFRYTKNVSNTRPPPPCNYGRQGSFERFSPGLNVFFCPRSVCRTMVSIRVDWASGTRTMYILTINITVFLADLTKSRLAHVWCVFRWHAKSVGSNS